MRCVARGLLAVVACFGTMSVLFADDDVLVVQPERLKLELELSGKFTSEQSVEISLRPQAWSKMEVLGAVAHGAAVQAGTPLIEFDLEDLQRAIVAAEQEAELARLALRKAEVSLAATRTTTPIAIEVAERGVKQAKDDLQYFLDVTRERSELSARESLKRSQFSLEYAQEELNQLRQMYEEDDLTEETEEIILKRAERSVESAEYSLESAEIRTKRTLEVDLPRQEQSLRESTARAVANVQTTTTSLEAALRQAEIELEKTRVAAEMAERKLGEYRADLEQLARVVSPIDGYVYYGRVHDGSWTGKEKAETYLKPGGAVPAKAVVMTVVAARVTHLQGTIAEKDLRKIRVGMAATGTAIVDPDTSFGVTVESVSAVPVSSGTFATAFRLSETISGVVEGMTGKVTVVIYDRENALLVPQSAVFGEEGGDRYVYVVDGEAVERRTVETGREKGDRVELVHGLASGETIKLEKPEGL